MTYTPSLVIHIGGGLVAVVSGFVALLARKGSRAHRKSGDVFSVAMLVMAASGAYVALIHSETVNIIAGTFTFYLVATGWVTVLRRGPQRRLADAAFLFLGLAVGIGALIAGIAAANGPKRGADAAVGGIVFGVVALLASAGDVRVIVRGGLSGARRLGRHLWRMCFAMLIATTSFFIGVAGDPVLRRTGLRARLFTPEVRKTHLPLVPVLVVLVLMIFWMIRVRFAKAYRSQPRVALSGPAAAAPSSSRASFPGIRDDGIAPAPLGSAPPSRG